ncbi:MAG: polysaccharide biosynthesis C-terminal domain-containing protein, partial [Lachnospiraceae bacterium]|nr:polysaccharide biosynthesis C-terminal domain-containing protein [Lachnospiraceae bacterium]
LLCGVSVNGVYGVAYKIPAILTVFQRIFAQSWQMSATKSYKEDESGDFFSGMFKSYQAFMVIGCSLLILFVRAIAGFMLQKDFFEAWRFVPPLLISVVFGALTGFIGSICLAHKDSKAMGISTFLGAFINILLNLLLIPKYSAMGAAIATGISYYTMFAMSLFIVKKHVVIKHSSLKDHLAYLLLVTEAVVMIRELPFMYIVSGMTVLILLFCYLGEFKKILEVITGRFKRQGN